MMPQGNTPVGTTKHIPACDLGFPPGEALAMPLLCSGFGDINGKKTDRVPTPQKGAHILGRDANNK